MRISMRIATIASLASVLVLGACRTEYESFEEKPPEYELVLELDSEAVAAGADVAWEAYLACDGYADIPVDAVLTSDLEPLVQYDSLYLTPTVAGDHVISAYTTYEDEEYEAQAPLAVDPGEAGIVDLQLEDYATTVGEGLGWAVQVWDDYGNELDASEVSVTTEDSELELEEYEVSTTVPGTYALVATAGGDDAVTDEEWFVVYEGATVSMSLELSDTDIELNETVTATVSTWDAYGNPTEDPWALSIEADLGADPESVTISYNNLTFWDEGVFTVVATVTVDATGDTLQDSVGPLTVDSSGPDLVITHPDRGDWSTVYEDEVTGTATDTWSGVASVMVDDDYATLAGDGSFSAPISYEFGTNRVETIAVDGEGNTTEDLRAVLTGAFAGYGGGIAEGIQARLNEGGFDTIEELASGMVTASDLDDLIPSPVYSADQEYCLDMGFYEYCYTLYSIYLYVTNPSISSVEMDIDPQSGALYTTFTVYDPYLDWSASGELSEIDYSGSGDIYASSITVSMYVSPYVSGGIIYADISDVAVSSSGFDFDFDSWIYEVLDYFGVDIDGLIQGYMEDALEDAVESEVPSLIEDVLQELELATSIDVLENTYDIDALPYSIQVDDAGLTLALETYFTARSWESPYTGEGSLYYDYSVPSYGSTPGMVLSLSEDFLNQALFAFWGGGILDMTMSGEELGLDVEDLSYVFPDLTELNIATEALLPPVVLPPTGSGLVDLQLGDYYMVIYGGPAEAGYEMMEVYVSLRGELDVTATESSITPELGDVEVWFDVVYPDANTVAAADTEALLDALVPLFLPVLTEAISEIPIPEIEGFTLSGISVGLSGAESGYLDIEGDLVME